VIALPLVRVQNGTIRQALLGDQGLAGARIRALAAPEARLARVPPHHPDAGGALVGGGPVSLPLMGTPAGRFIGVGMGRAVFPPRCGPARPPQRRGQSSRQSGRSRAGGLGGAAAGYAAVCVPPQLAPEARRGLALGHPAPQPHKRAGRCRVFSKTLPVSHVSSASLARQR
jgi:hypothetical protein